jgi:hypothetical protein
MARIANADKDDRHPEPRRRRRISECATFAKFEILRRAQDDDVIRSRNDGEESPDSGDSSLRSE